MAHRRPHRLFAGIVERHPNFAVKNFECWAVPILDDVVMGGKARVNEAAPICHAQLSNRMVKELMMLRLYFCVTFLTTDLKHGENMID